jgi:hypothetical protein
MSIFNTTVRRGVGALLLTGAAAGLISLATSGVAGATPDQPRIPVIPPGNTIVRAVDPGINVELNPQPLPPKEWAPGIDVALNPQPLPPGPPDPGPDFWLFRGLLPGF